MRKGFNFYRSYYDVAKELSEKDRAAFLWALIQKQFDNKPADNLTGNAKFAYISQEYSINQQVKGYFDKTKDPLFTPTEPPCQQEKEKEKEKEKEQADDFVNLDFAGVYLKWMEYKKERKESYVGKKSKEQFYNKLLTLSGNNPNIAEEIVNQSMANNWAGIFELKNKQVTLAKTYNTKGTIPNNSFNG